MLDDDAIQFLEKLPKDIGKRIFQKIQSTKENPHHYFSRLTGRTDYKLRVGKYRIIADLDDDKKRIEVTHIDKRDTVYE